MYRNSYKITILIYYKVVKKIKHSHNCEQEIMHEKLALYTKNLSYLIFKLSKYY